MKVKGNEKILSEEDVVETSHTHGHAHDNDYNSGVLKIKTAIGKMHKQEDSEYRHVDPKRFKKNK